MKKNMKLAAILLATISFVATATGGAFADDIESVLKAQKDRIAAINKARATAVSVFVKGGGGGGSGVVITPDGYALTNFHVSKPAGSHMKCSMPDGVLYDGVIVGIDPTGDVALIKLLGRDDFPHAELADSDEVKAGDWCFAVGNPFLLATNFEPTVTYGIVSGVHRYQYPAGTLLEYADCIQTDASINPGNSGGPLFDAKGRLIGINGRGSFEKRGRVNVGVGYAISINQIKHFMGYLRSGRIVDHATLGASVSTSEDGKVVVSNIIDTCDAYRRGLRYDDEIVAFGGRPITTTNGFKNVLGIYPRGWRVPLSYRREGKRYDILVRLMGVHSGEDLIAKIQPNVKPIEPPKPKDEEPEDGKEEGENEDEPEKKLPLPIKLPIAPKAASPPHVAKLIEARRGYANYYFNKLNRNRVWEAFISGTDFTTVRGDWKITGQLSDGGEFEAVLSDDKAVLTLPGGAVTINPKKDLDLQLAPEGSGGMLAALSLWRRLLVREPENFGEVYYLGTAPMAGEDELVDILVGTHGVIESRFNFAPSSGRLLAVEMFPDSYVDPCELILSEQKEVDGRTLPHRIEIRHGDKVFETLEIKSFELQDAPKES